MPTGVIARSGDVLVGRHLDGFLTGWLAVVLWCMGLWRSHGGPSIVPTGQAVLLPAAVWLGQSWVEIALLAGSVTLVMIVELLNTGIETAIDRIGPEWHDLSKRAKDMGSAAVLLSLLLCAAAWVMALFQRFVG